MRPDEFFKNDEFYDYFETGEKKPALDIELLRQLRSAPLPGRDDTEVAGALARLIHDELEKYGTQGELRFWNDGMREALQALRAVAKRLGITGVEVPFRDFTGFYDYYRRKGIVGSGSWQGRRDLLNEIFDPLHDQLADLEQRALESGLAEPISPHARTGWSAVDTELDELRRHFRSARTAQDYRNVGNDCVGVIEALSRTVYDPAVHLRPGETEPPVDKTKQRLGRFIEDAAPGAGNEELRSLARAAIEYTHRVKHSETPTRRQGGIAADAVIQLASMLRRLSEQE